MKKTSYVCKVIGAVTAAAMCAMPLIACGDGDEGGRRGIKVTEQQREKCLNAILDCRNYTEIFKKTEYGQTKKKIIKFDIDNNVVSKESYSIDGSASTSYTFLYPIEDSEYYWVIEMYENGEDGTEIYSETLSLRNYKRSQGGYIGSFADEILLNSDRYVFTFNDKDGSYVSNNTDALYKAYYSEKYLISAYSEYRRYDSGDIRISTVDCSDFGTTKVTVPADVKALVDEYKAANVPPPVEEEY